MQQKILDGESVVVEPRPQRGMRAFSISISLVLAPPLLSLVALTWNRPALATVLQVATGLALLSLLIGFRLGRMRVVFTPDEIIEHTFLGRAVVIPLSELVSVRVISVYSGRSLETHTQVFFLDSAGRTRLRLRGSHWGDRVVSRAANAYGLPIDKSTDPVSRSELRRRIPANLHLYERHPIASGAVLGAAIVSVSSPLLGVLTSLS